MNLSWLDLLLLALFCWRTAHLITSESGPFNIVGRFRARFPLGGLTTCVKCASVWTAVLGWLLWTYGGDAGHAVVIVGAVSGAALMLSTYTGAAHS